MSIDDGADKTVAVTGDNELSDIKLKLAALLEHSRKHQRVVGVDDAVVSRLGRAYSILSDSLRDSGASIDIVKIVETGRDAVIRVSGEQLVFTSPEILSLAVDMADIVDVVVDDRGRTRIDFTFTKTYIVSEEL